MAALAVAGVGALCISSSVAAVMMSGGKEEGTDCTADTPVPNAADYQIDAKGECVVKSCVSGYEKSDNMCSLLALSGGTVSDFAGYKIHAFTESGTLTVEENVDVECLIVAGGGG